VLKFEESIERVVASDEEKENSETCSKCPESQTSAKPLTDIMNTVAPEKSSDKILVETAQNDQVIATNGKKQAKKKVNSKSIKYITSLLDKLMQERQAKLEKKFKLEN